MACCVVSLASGYAHPWKVKEAEHWVPEACAGTWLIFSCARLQMIAGIVGGEVSRTDCLLKLLDEDCRKGPLWLNYQLLHTSQPWPTVHSLLSQVALRHSAPACLWHPALFNSISVNVLPCRLTSSVRPRAWITWTVRRPSK